MKKNYKTNKESSRADNDYVSASADRENKLEYADFLTCLMKLAVQCYPSSKTCEDALQQLLMDNVLPFASRRRPVDITPFLNQSPIEHLYKYYEESLMNLFVYYASASDHKKLQVNTAASGISPKGKTFDDISLEISSIDKKRVVANSQINHIGYADFLRFCGDYGLSSMGLTMLDLGDIYLTVIGFKAYELSFRKLNFKDFWQALIRCALVAFRGLAHASTEDKVKGMLLHVWRRIKSTAQPNAATAGSAGQIRASQVRESLHSAILPVRTHRHRPYSQLYNERFVSAWTRDKYRDYLQPVQAPSVYAEDTFASKSVLQNIISRNNKSKQQKDATDQDNYFNDKVKLRIPDDEPLVDERIKPSQLRALLRARPDIVQMLNALATD